MLFDRTLPALSESSKGANLFHEKMKGITAIGFGSGGAMGVALIGAMQALEENGLDVSKVTTMVGVSAGSIQVILLALLRPLSFFLSPSI